MNFEDMNNDQNEKNLESNSRQVKAPDLDMDKIAASVEILTFFYWRNISEQDCTIMVEHAGSADVETFERQYDFIAGGRGWFGITAGEIKIYYKNQSLALNLIGDKTDYFIWINENGVMEYSFDTRYKDKNESL